MDKPLVVGPDQMPDWLEKKRRVFGEIEKQVNHSLEGSGKGLTLDQLQAVVEHRNPFAPILAGDYSGLVAEWQKFYDDLKITANYANLVIPAKPKGRDRLLVIPQGPTIQSAYDKCATLFQCWKYASGSLDEAIPTNDRDPKNGAYAIWVRNRVEADKELKNLSANDLARKQIKGITVLERLIYELKYFKETGKHLDIENVTLCSGSRCADGDVPCVDWRDGRLKVSWASLDSAHPDLRSRVAV